ncbi:MAG: hypothetical protein ACTS2F_14420 [Thainema sp.]
MQQIETILEYGKNAVIFLVCYVALGCSSDMFLTDHERHHLEAQRGKIFQPSELQLEQIKYTSRDLALCKTKQKRNSKKSIIYNQQMRSESQCGFFVEKLKLMTSEARKNRIPQKKINSAIEAGKRIAKG